MIKFNLLELLYLRRLVYNQIEYLKTRHAKYQRFSCNHPDIDDYEHKIALVESEYRSMHSMLSKIDDTVAMMDMISTFRENQHFNE